jgi:hypothetical protein
MCTEQTCVEVIGGYWRKGSGSDRYPLAGSLLPMDCGETSSSRGSKCEPNRLLPVSLTHAAYQDHYCLIRFGDGGADPRSSWRSRFSGRQ